MATPFESVYSKFLDSVDDYELGLIEDDELNDICFRYLEKARAIYFPQCSKNLDDVTIKLQSEIDAELENPVTDEELENAEDNGDDVDGESASDAPVEDTGGVGDVAEESEADVITPVTLDSEPNEETVDTEPEVELKESIEEYKVDKTVGYFNEDLTNREQYILALGMKKAWISSKKYSADLMTKDVGDRDYKAVQGFNYLKEIGNLDKQLEEEIRDYGIAYTYSVEALGVGW